MGWSYLVFRIGYQIKLKSGWLKTIYPVEPQPLAYPDLQFWLNSASRFFNIYKSKTDPLKASELRETVKSIKNGEIPFFDNLWFKLGPDYDWVTNPQSGFQYDKNQHWTTVSDFSGEQGDIKFVWEKSRFLYVYPVIRYDRYSGEDQAHWVIPEILSWIEANPINCGPNYKCSQEIALRVMNWIYVLSYYRNSSVLTEEIFQKLMHHIYWQMHHVYQNINFSRKAVRNNHTLTEALGLCLVGSIFPGLPNAERWKLKGQYWFEEALEYQVFEDGSYLQYSMNYHRVVAQLLTWAIILGRLNTISWNKIVYQKADKSLKFLLAHIQSNGHLPNYGANDGALFFPVCTCEFRDYRPQLNALQVALTGKSIFDSPACREALDWLGIDDTEYDSDLNSPGVFQFNQGGYYGFRDINSYTFIRCGSHPFRPSQADNLHLDLWWKGENIMRDAGSFQYNTDPDLVRFFTGTSSHNTVMLNGLDQMEKGPRFIWLDWSEAVSAQVSETAEKFIFEGTIKAFKHLAADIHHRRKVIKYKDQPRWIVDDEIIHHNSFEMTQIWNPGPAFDNFQIRATDQQGNDIEPIEKDGWFSNSYGHKEKARQIRFNTTNKTIRTEIRPGK